jgi:drug/metabolite transporter (DMT)-like permease
MYISPYLILMDMERQNQAYVYALFVILFWATVASAFKLALNRIDPFQLLLYSSLISVITLFIILLAQGKTRILIATTGRELISSAALGLISPCMYYIILFQAYSRLNAQEAQPLNQTWILLLPLLSILLLGQKIKVKSLIALSIGFIGVFIISSRGDMLGLKFGNPLGVMLALFSAVLWSVFWIFNLRDKRDEVVKLFLNFAFGFLFILIATLLFSNIFVSDKTALFWAAYIGVFEMGITFVLWLMALKLSKTTAQVSILIYIVPILSLFVIHFLVGEDILWTTVAGLAFILVGILVQQYNELTRTVRKQTPQSKS